MLAKRRELGEACRPKYLDPRSSPSARAGAQWLRLRAVALALLALSEALWVWQTWPVRELLHPAAAAPRSAR
jgi:hypothetical protein